jgi:hypothetical protein
MKQYETIWNNMKQYETIWNNMKQFETIWNNIYEGIGLDTNLTLTPSIWVQQIL